MRTHYDDKAIALAQDLYCKYVGTNHAAIEAEMRKAGYPKWSKSILFDRGKGKDARLGWINRFGFEQALERHSKLRIENVANDDQREYLKLQEICSRLETRAMKPDATRDDLYIYRDFLRLKLEVKTKLDVSHDNFETFAACYELLTKWLGDIDPITAKGFAKNGERLIEMAQAHYGKENDQVDGGADSSEVEGGERPPEGPGKLRLVG